MIRVQVVIALAQGQEVFELELAAGARVADALAAPPVAVRLAALGLQQSPVGVWSRRCEPAAALRDGDRVEIYRPLAADAKAQRRARLRTSSRRPRSAP